MARLTAGQREQLQRMAELRLPASMVRRNYPGFPYTMLDMRSVGALLRRGLVEGVVYNRPVGPMPCYRITEAGRAALKDKDTDDNE